MNLIQKFKEYIRVFKVAKKPEDDEFRSTIRSCLIGIAIVGIVGFIFYIISATLLSGL